MSCLLGVLSPLRGTRWPHHRKMRSMGREGLEDVRGTLFFSFSSLLARRMASLRLLGCVCVIDAFDVRAVSYSEGPFYLRTVLEQLIC